MSVNGEMMSKHLPAAALPGGAAITSLHLDRSLRVLFVEDNDVDREILARYLRVSWPVERMLDLHCAANSREALEKLAATVFDLVFLDWQLPFADGRDVLRALRRGRDAGTPTVIVSALQREEIPLDLDSFGVMYLCKDDLNSSNVRTVVTHVLRLPTSPDGRNRGEW